MIDKVDKVVQGHVLSIKLNIKKEWGYYWAVGICDPKKWTANIKKEWVYDWARIDLRPKKVNYYIDNIYYIDKGG